MTHWALILNYVRMGSVQVISNAIKLLQNSRIPMSIARRSWDANKFFFQLFVRSHNYFIDRKRWLGNPRVRYKIIRRKLQSLSVRMRERAKEFSKSKRQVRGFFFFLFVVRYYVERVRYFIEYLFKNENVFSISVHIWQNTKWIISPLLKNALRFT